MIDSVESLQKLVLAGETNWKQYGDVFTQEMGDLILFNYSPMAAIAGRWNFFESVSRGLILNRHTGEIIARPFDKFWNWGEGNRRSDGQIACVTEKMDGSLGILYRANGSYKIATRGSMRSDQAMWATEHLHNGRYALDGLPESYTLLFEIIYPANRIVVDYSGFEGLVLLAIRNRSTGEFLPFETVAQFANDHGFKTPRVYSFADSRQIAQECQKLDGNHEGFVVEFSDGQRFKFKGERYLELHRLVSSISYRNTLQAVASGTIQDILSAIPDEFLSDVRRWIAEIEMHVVQVKSEVETAFAAAPKDTRKSFAQFVTAHHKRIAPYLFAKLDGKAFDWMIYKTLEDAPTR